MTDTPQASQTTPASDATPPAADRAGRERGARRGKGSADDRGRGGRADLRGDTRRRDGRRPPRVDLSPPRFNVDELAALAGPPLWQAVHDATIIEVNAAAAVVEVEPAGHPPLRALILPAEAAGLSVGEAVRVRLGDKPKAGDVLPTASVRQARSLDALDKLAATGGADMAAPGYVVREVKGGYSVALYADNDDGVLTAVRAFLPSSQVGLGRFGPRADDVLGHSYVFDIVEIEPERANVVVSRRARLQAERKADVEKRLAAIREGEVLKATVKTIMPYGAFLDLGGVDGMVHQTDLTWDGRTRAADVLKPGQQVDVKVLAKSAETGKLKLGIKQLTPDPWAEMRAAFAEGSIAEGTVVALTDFGAFVRLVLPETQQPVEGLIHVSELSWTKVKHPSQKFRIGDVVMVKVLGLDTEARRISLSTKALERNPFESVAEKFPVGAVVRAKIKSLADFGAFVELADGLDGLIHIGELSWIAHPKHPSELLNIGQEVEAVVINIDVAKQRVGLSIKRTAPNPFDAWERKYQRGARLKLKVLRVDDKGAWLEVEDGLTCFCFVRDLVGKEGDGTVERAQDAVKMGQEVEVEVKTFDRRFKKVSVSMRAVIEGDTRDAYDEYKKREGAEGVKLNPLADKLKALQKG